MFTGRYWENIKIDQAFMRLFHLILFAATLGVPMVPHQVWGKASPSDLEGKGPPNQFQNSGMSWKLLISKANQMYEIGNLDKALEYANRLKKLEPNIPGGWRISGLVKSDRQEFDAAEKDLQKCISLTEMYFGKDVISLQYDFESLGYVYKRLQQLEDAIAAYKRSVAINPARSYYIDQLILSCQRKYAKKYGKLDPGIFLESDFRKNYNLFELAEQRLIIREFRHSDGGRWALEEQKISIIGEERIDRVTLSCERCNAVKIVEFHINYGPDKNKHLDEITDRYLAALKDKDADIRIFAVSQLKLLGEKWFTTMAQDSDPWVRLSVLRYIEVNKPEMKHIKDFMVDPDQMVNRYAVKMAKSIIGRQSTTTD